MRTSAWITVIIFLVVPCQLTLATSDYLYVSWDHAQRSNSVVDVPTAVAKLFRKVVLCLPVALELSTLLSRHKASSPPSLTRCPTYDNCLFLMFLRRLPCSPNISSTLSSLNFLVHGICNSLIQHYIFIPSSSASVLLLSVHDSNP